ncbi:type VI secretion system contractile sheath domain-containing protein [Candidatus Thiodiazotropha sp. LNASS1]|uniref:type VI secretion system contractile sheath domain-containing protein n=1 Tax=Candidatus Thiodiazotropha sp. LNASS1 TaxID=3096260 RepID=UPI002831C231|nr:type VI secretion system contractile sheath large subunit [Candidatus Thiodiazotropha endolucinida]
MSERMHFSVELGRKRDRNHIQDSAKGFTIVMLGSFGGGTGTGNPITQNGPSLHSIETDTIDKKIAKLHPSLTLLGDSGQQITLRFESLDDFHPDGLLDQLADYRPVTGEQQTLTSSDHRAEEISADDERSDENESQKETLSRLLGQRPLSVEQQQESGSSLNNAKQSMIADVVRRLAENASGADQSDTSGEPPAHTLDETDKTILLRSVLHNESFQKLEASWRSVDWLLHSIEPDPSIKCYLLDIRRSELELEQSSHTEPTTSPLYRVIRETLERQDLLESSFILIDNHDYGPDQESTTMLDWLGLLMDRFDGTLLAGSASSLLNDQVKSGDSFNAWNTFRKQPSARRIALLYPEMLLRLPYGSATDPIQSLSFEELNQNWTIDEMLWGNPAYAQAVVLINRWMTEGDRVKASVLTDLPAFTYQSEGEHHLQPCTKLLLNEQQIEQLLNLGLVPVIGSRNRNTIQLPWFQHLGFTSG